MNNDPFRCACGYYNMAGWISCGSCRQTNPQHALQAVTLQAVQPERMPVLVTDPVADAPETLVSAVPLGREAYAGRVLAIIPCMSGGWQLLLRHAAKDTLNALRQELAEAVARKSALETALRQKGSELAAESADLARVTSNLEIEKKARSHAQSEQATLRQTVLKMEQSLGKLREVLGTERFLEITQGKVGVGGDRCEPGNECGRTGCERCQR